MTDHRTLTVRWFEGLRGREWVWVWVWDLLPPRRSALLGGELASLPADGGEFPLAGRLGLGQDRRRRICQKQNPARPRVRAV
jgi:hypothetical protein